MVDKARASGQAPAQSQQGSRSGGTRRVKKLGAGSATPVVVAVLVSVVFQQLIGTVVPEDAYLYRLFRPAGGWLMSVVPGLIAFVLLWTLTDLFLKFRSGRINDLDLRRTDVMRLPQVVAKEAASETMQRVRTWDRSLLMRPVGRRVLWVLHHLNATDPQRAHELLRHQSDLDADSAASGYRTVKLFIWAMPILGFIGTVLGISLAVGGFSEFLGTSVSIDEIDTVTAELGEVASGLSFAFDTTLLGLLAGLVASVVSSTVEEREERVFTALDELGLRILESGATLASQSAAAAPVRVAPSSPGAAFDAMMEERLEELGAQMTDFTRSVGSGLDGFLTEWAKLPPEVDKVASDLTGLRQHLTSAARSTDRMITETSALMEGLREASERMGSELESSVRAVDSTVQGLEGNLKDVTEVIAKNMAGMEEANQRLANAIDALTPILQQLSGPMEVRLMPVANRPGTDA
jgi:biopolymer transport protein ExbB/TolQ